MDNYGWVMPVIVWWIILSLFAVMCAAAYAERKPMGLISKLVKKLENKMYEVINSPAELARQPEGTVIEDARGIMLERHEGRWVNMKGRPQNRITLPAHIIS
jgi:hypothetical protein